MKKTIICNISMQSITPTVYKSKDETLNASPEHYRFAVNTYMGNNMVAGDEYKVILVATKDKNDAYRTNIQLFKEEINNIAQKVGNVKLEYVEKVFDFSQEKAINQELMVGLMNEIEDESSIIADVTYGPKSLPIIEFTILGFAENHLNCDIEHIFYGKANFGLDKRVDPENGELCDLVPLFYLTAVTNMLNVNDTKEARKAYETLINM